MEAGQRRLKEIQASQELPAEVADLLRARQEHRRRQLISDDLRATVAELKLDLIKVEREYLFELLRSGRITDEARRRLERELDLEEAAILSRRGEDEDILPL
jgi:CPA1 family monovalent cation:H+ antiporter